LNSKNKYLNPVVVKKITLPVNETEEADKQKRLERKLKQSQIRSEMRRDRDEDFSPITSEEEDDDLEDFKPKESSMVKSEYPPAQPSYGMPP
jgi:hypothetical protein